MQRFSELDGWPLASFSSFSRWARRGEYPLGRPKKLSPPGQQLMFLPSNLLAEGSGQKTSFLSTKQIFFGRLRRPI